eukprot:TRINITY_DN6627_c0_g1_i2.p1 TRINITY_DN6627_c0_g1~~TRINITY_DN6627_c0_g1_i2.p1  ORF type:complete len:319 (+),score=46.69 TRINITY_DN6627_c0_g1_i2:78-1034(+)
MSVFGWGHRVRSLHRVPIVYHPQYVVRWERPHRFPIRKFTALFRSLLERRIISVDQIYRAPRASRDWISAAHHPSFVDRVFDMKMERVELTDLALPMDHALVERVRYEVGGTVAAALLAVQHGLACNLAGGTHHAHADRPSGFCLFNDLAVATKYLLNAGICKRILIFDCDVHQGDGTASILSSDANVFTCSIHCKDNFPFVKQKSTLDVELSRGCNDQEYQNVLQSTLPMVIDAFKPDFVFYDAGVDIYEGDGLGNLKVSFEGIRRRDEYVIQHIRQRGIPMACVIGGGYDTDISRLALRHSLVVEAASKIFDGRIS